MKNGGGYSVPSGNLLRPGAARTKPEIFAVGFRNPFRMAVDKKSNNVYVGDYSPDAQAPDPERGPQGIGRWMLVDRPGNYGWTYCMTRTIGYVDYDFATQEFPCPKSPNNTGRRVLPEVVQPDVYYSYPENDFGLFPELFEDTEGDGIGPMGGPAYDFKRPQPVRDQVAEGVRRPPAVLRVDARLLQGLRAQPQERQPARRHPQPVPGRSERDHPGQPDGRWPTSSATTSTGTQSSTAGCEGDIQVPPADAGHQGENIAAVFVAGYTDNPVGETPQTGTDEVILREGQ